MASPTQKNSYISSSRSFPYTILVPVLLLLLINFGLLCSGNIRRLLFYYSEPRRDDLLRSEIVLRNMQSVKLNKVLIVGSSQAQDGFDTEYMNRPAHDRNMKFYKIGSPAFSPAELYAANRKIFKAEPDVVVFVVSVINFYDQYSYGKFIQHFSPSLLLAFWSEFGIREIWHNRESVFHGIVGHISPLYRFRANIPKIIKTAIFENYSGNKRKAPIDFVTVNSEKNVEFLERANKAKPPKEISRYNRSKYTKLYQKMIDDFARHAESAGIGFVVIEGPVYPGYRNYYDQSLESELYEFFSQNSRENNYKFIFGKDLPKFVDEDFYDYTHLNAQGRQKYSQFLINLLYKRPAL